jgi:hypothetical protein
MACEYLNNVFTDLRQIKFPRFSDILWIDASSNMTIELALMQIAQDKNAPNEAKKPSESVLKWIALQRNNWLMVYDGADGDYQIVEKFLLPGGGGNIVITSRNVGLKRISLKSQKVVNMTVVLQPEWTPTLHIPDMSDRHCHFSFQLTYLV